MSKRWGKKSLFLQITNACNLSCTFCSEGEQVPQPRLFMDVGFIENLVEDFKRLNGERVVLTGGEPSLHVDLERIINGILSSGLKVKVDTNATVLFEGYKEVSDPASTHIQCSLEGEPEQNDRIRGPGVFLKAKENLHKYAKEGFNCSIKLTLVPTTCSKDIETLARVSARLGVSKLSLAIVKYFGKAKDEGFKFETGKFRDLLERVPDLQKKFGVKIELSDYVPFLPHLKDHYAKACKGINNYFVFIDGKVVPCRFLDNVVLGNVYKESLIDIFKRGSILDTFRPSKECEECGYLDYCGGGCRYRALKYRDINSCDPACFRSCNSGYLPL